MKKVFFAQEAANQINDDLYELDKDKVLIEFLSTDGDAVIFKDGSMLVSADRESLAMNVLYPNKELSLSFFEQDDVTYLNILDNRDESEIGDVLFNSSLRNTIINKDGSGAEYMADEQMFSAISHLTVDELNEKLSSMGLNPKLLEEASKSKNELGKIKSFVAKIKSAFSNDDKKETKKNKKKFDIKQ